MKVVLHFARPMPLLSWPAVDVATGHFGTRISYDDAEVSAEIVADIELKTTDPEYDALEAAAQQASVSAATIATATAETLASAQNMVQYGGYFGALQLETRRSIVRRDDLATHYAALLLVLQSDDKMWGDFVHTLYLWHGLAEADLFAQNVRAAVMQQVVFSAAIFMTAGASTALFPLAFR